MRADRASYQRHADDYLSAPYLRRARHRIASSPTHAKYFEVDRTRLDSYIRKCRRLRDALPLLGMGRADL